jgi:transcriptional regulator with GAF, ATPase, and Fis domain
VDDSTITGDVVRQKRAVEASVPMLVFVANADHPGGGSSAHSLGDVDEVLFRRGQRAVERDARRLVLAFPDVRMSSEHGRLVRQAGRWLVDDPGSKNGTVVNGTLVRRTLLNDGDVIELGHSFFLFRETVGSRLPHLTADIDADGLAAQPRGLATFCPSLAQELRSLVRIASSSVSIMLLGETGTGKEVVARAIHTLSQRTGTFVAVNCGALPQTLLEAELFGHRRGAFSGAVADRRGLVRSADGGTLFLDEIGELPLSSQAAFLRVLQAREVLPVGEDRAVPVDLRLVTATLRPLDEWIADGRFRPDLYARVAGHIVSLPPLRDRKEDLGLLLADLLSRLAVDRSMRLAAPALRALIRYDWPLNIRELEQALTTALALADEGEVQLDDLPVAVRAARKYERPLPDAPDLDGEDQHLRATLVALFEEHGGNVVAVAEALGKRRAQIYRWIKRLGIDISSFRRA